MMSGLEAGVSCPGRPSLPGQARHPYAPAGAAARPGETGPSLTQSRSSGTWGDPSVIGMTLSEGG